LFQDPGALDERVEAFLERHAEILQKMTDDEFKVSFCHTIFTYISKLQLDL
jgi:hypothetical protein